MKHTALLLFSTIVCFSTVAQDRGFRSEGREFYLAYLHPTLGSYYENYFKVYALISSYEENEVTVAYFNTSGKEVDIATYPVGANGIVKVLLDRLRMRPDSVGDRAEYVACHITSKRPISLQYYSMGPNACGSYLAMPVSAWGKKHVVASYNDNPATGAYWIRERSSGEFTVVAAFDGTVVQIIPTAKTCGGHVGVMQGPGATGKPQPYSVTLAKGQCYYVRSQSSDNGNEDDISGTIVTATHPVAVIAGHEDAFTGNSWSTDLSDLRDFMIEQMIPVEFWDNQGLVAIPTMDTKGTTEGIGNNYKLYVSDEKTPASVSGNGLSHSTAIYTAPELFSITYPMNFSADSANKRFTAVQYDLRAHGTSSPYTAPSMSSIVPVSQWRNAYAWIVPMNQTMAKFTNYMTVLCDAANFDKIVVKVGNLAPQPINVALPSAVKTWYKGSIDGFPDMKAVTYDISLAYWLGTNYFASAPFPFMVYPHGNPTTYVNSSYYYYDSYANPGGMSVFDKDVQNWLNITIDTLCTGGWKICATDDHPGGGIRFISLLDDPRGNLFANRNYQYSNVSILAPEDPMRLGEITLNGDNKSYCFTIGVNDPGKDAYAPVIIYDKAGNYNIIELRQSPKKLTVTPDPFTTPELFAGSKLGVKICRTLTVHNDITNPTWYKIDSLSIGSPSSFTIAHVKPQIPAIIPPGDSLLFDVCFEASDTLMHRDTIRLTGTCLDIRLPLAASTVRPILVASDASFGKILVGNTLCKQVTLKNTGQASFKVQGGTFVQNSPSFAFDTVTQSRFPFTLAPGQTEPLTICYTPDTIRTHSGWISWQTDILPPYAAEQKAITNLSGEGYEELKRVTGEPLDDQPVIRPNPARDRITIELARSSGEAVVTVYDVLGRVIRSNAFEGSSFELMLPKVADGLYYVHVKAGEKVYTLPIEIRK